MSAQGHTKRRRERERGGKQEEGREGGRGLNRIISSQIINGIILGCSLGNPGQLDAGGNNGRRREEQARRDKGNPVRSRDEKIQNRGSVGGEEESISVYIELGFHHSSDSEAPSLADKQEITTLIGLG